MVAELTQAGGGDWGVGVGQCSAPATASSWSAREPEQRIIHAHDPAPGSRVLSGEGGQGGQGRQGTSSAAQESSRAAGQQSSSVGEQQRVRVRQRAARQRGWPSRRDAGSTAALHRWSTDALRSTAGSSALRGQGAPHGLGIRWSGRTRCSGLEQGLSRSRRRSEDTGGRCWQGPGLQINSGAVNGLMRGRFPEAPASGSSRLGLPLLGDAAVDEQQPSVCEGTPEARQSDARAASVQGRAGAMVPS